MLEPAPHRHVFFLSYINESEAAGAFRDLSLSVLQLCRAVAGLAQPGILR